MKKKASAAAGVIVAAVILALSYWQQPEGEKPVSAAVSEISSLTGTAGINEGNETASSAGSGSINAAPAIPASSDSGKTITAPETAAPAGSAGADGMADTTRSPIVIPDTEGLVPDGFIPAGITEIVDGDTVKADIKGKEYKVRLLCIDTPETVKKGVSVQPYGKKASEKLSELLLGKEVTLVFEKDIEDKYGRLLAFVILKDGTCVNAFMVEQGYARMDVVRPNTAYKEYFAWLQEKAIREKKGMWALPEKERPFVKNEKGYYIPRYSKEAA